MIMVSCSSLLYAISLSTLVGHSAFAAQIVADGIMHSPWPDEKHQRLHCANGLDTAVKQMVHVGIFTQRIDDAYLAGSFHQGKLGTYTSVIESEWKGVKLVVQYNITITTNFRARLTTTSFEFLHAGSTVVSLNCFVLCAPC